MTNINCSANCIYQKDGKCSFESVSAETITPNNFCAYYKKGIYSEIEDFYK